MNFPHIKAIIFDYGNVLYAWDAYGAIAGRVHSEQWEEYVDHGEFARWNAMADAGHSREQVEAALRSAYPDRTDWHDIQNLYWENFSATLTGPIPGSAGIVKDLAHAGVPLYLLTNFHHELFAANRHLCPELRLFQGIVVSGEEQCVKPHLDIFNRLLCRYHLHASETLFIDDNCDNVAAAKSVGLQTHLFTTSGRLRAALADYGLLSAEGESES